MLYQVTKIAGNIPHHHAFLTFFLYFFLKDLTVTFVVFVSVDFWNIFFSKRWRISFKKVWVLYPISLISLLLENCFAKLFHIRLHFLTTKILLLIKRKYCIIGLLDIQCLFRKLWIFKMQLVWKIIEIKQTF